MKTITINVSEPIYAEFQAFAAKNDRPTSEIIREAMAEYRRAHIKSAKSIADISPISLGKPIGKIDLNNLADEMLA